CRIGDVRRAASGTRCRPVAVDRAGLQAADGWAGRAVHARCRCERVRSGPGRVRGRRGRMELDAGPALEAETAGAGAFGDGSLEDPADEAPRGSEEVEVKGRFERDLDMLESRIAGLQLVDDAPPGADPTGAVVVLAGIGGPDAVRQ